MEPWFQGGVDVTAATVRQCWASQAESVRTWCLRTLHFIVFLTHVKCAVLVIFPPFLSFLLETGPCYVSAHTCHSVATAGLRLTMWC